MPYVYLISSVFSMAFCSILGAFYTRRTMGRRDPAALYSFLYFVALFLLWSMVYLFDFSFEVRVLPYTFLFAFFFTLSLISGINAVRIGPVMLTSLISQTSLVAVSLWGIFFWGAEFSLNVVIGLVMVVVSLCLCLYVGKAQGGVVEKISLRWLIWCILAFVGNAGCSIAQRTQQMVFDGQHKGMLMCFAMAISAIMGLVLYIKSDRTDSIVIIKTNGAFPIVAAGLNMLLNLFVMLMATTDLSPNLIYPTLAVGGLILTSMFSLIVFREKLKWWQWIGVVIGISATALLS